MNRFLVALAILLPIGCNEVPPIEIGGDGDARLLDGRARDAHDAYNQAHAQIAPQHLRTRRSLEPRGQNLHGAQGSIERIISSLETMKALVTSEFQPKFDPYLAKYREWHRDIGRNTWGGSFFQEFDQSEREIKSSLALGSVKIAAETVTHAPGDPAPVGLLYRAWDRAHEALVAAFKDKKDCKAPYQDVADALRLMKAKLDGKRAELLQYQIDWYASIHEKTKAFTAPAEQDVVDDLNVPARVIRKEFKPEP